MDPNLEKQIDRFGELADQIDAMKSELETKVEEYKILEESLRPVLESLTGTQENFLKTKAHLVRIKKMGFDRTNFKYKEAFELAMSKVNTTIKRILSDALDANKSTTRVLSAVGVQDISESIGGAFLQKIKRYFGSFAVKIGFNNKKLDKYNNFMGKIVRSNA